MTLRLPEFFQKVRKSPSDAKGGLLQGGLHLKIDADESTAVTKTPQVSRDRWRCVDSQAAMNRPITELRQPGQLLFLCWCSTEPACLCVCVCV